MIIAVIGKDCMTLAALLFTYSLFLSHAAHENMTKRSSWKMLYYYKPYDDFSFSRRINPLAETDKMTNLSTKICMLLSSASHAMPNETKPCII